MQAIEIDDRYALAYNNLSFWLNELAENPVVIAEIERQLEEVMEPFNNAERVKKVKVLGEEWLPDSELLTPTSKLKRRGVNSHFADEIESIYS